MRGKATFIKLAIAALILTATLFTPLVSTTEVCRAAVCAKVGESCNFDTRRCCLGQGACIRGRCFTD